MNHAKANWPISHADGTVINATAVSAATNIASTDALAMAEDVLIDNPGPNDVYVKAGPAGVVATTASVRVPAGSLQPYAKGAGQRFLAVRTSSGSQTIVVHCGDGQ